MVMGSRVAPKASSSLLKKGAIGCLSASVFFGGTNTGRQAASGTPSGRRERPVRTVHISQPFLMSEAEVTAGAHPKDRQPIDLRYERIKRVLGIELEQDEIIEILTRLGMEVKSFKDHWMVKPPSFRFDIEIEADLLEELHAMILQDSAGFEGVNQVLYVGDYIDRGNNSKGVIDTLLGDSLPGFESIFLVGNHEYAIINFL